AVVVGDDMVLPLVLAAVAASQLPGALHPGAGLLGGDLGGQILAFHAAETARQFDGAVGVLARQDAGALGATLAQDAGELAGVHARDRHDALGFQVVGQRLGGAEVGQQGGAVAHHQAGGMHAAGLDVFGVDAGIADVGIGQGDDLAAVAGIGEDLLVA